MTEKEIAQRIGNIAEDASKFKIGKTGLKVYERFEDYSSYGKVKPIYMSTFKQHVDDLETKMIKKFKDYENNKNNLIDGGNDMDDEDRIYSLYVVYSQENNK